MARRKTENPTATSKASREDGHDASQELAPMFSDAHLLLVAGNRNEVRKVLGALGELMQQGPEIFPLERAGAYMSFLADALVAIGKGADANVALRLQTTGRDKSGIQESIDLLRLVRHLVDAGDTEQQAIKRLAEYRARGADASKVEKEMDRLRKALEVAKPRFWKAKALQAGVMHGEAALQAVAAAGRKKVV